MSGVHDPVRGYLARRGAAAHVVAGGLAGLVAGWERFCGEVERGYALGLEDYLNDLDQRQLIADAWPHATRSEQASLRQGLRAADAGFRAATVAREGCVWGPEVARRHGLTRTRAWWTYVVPCSVTGPLLDELG